MDEGKIAGRYAKALLSLANERKLTESVNTDMGVIHQLLESYPRFNYILVSPVITTHEKETFFKEVFANSINQLSYSFLTLLLRNKREAYLKSMTRIFLESYRKETGFKKATLISAIEIDSSTVDQFKAFIRKHFNSEVDLTCTSDKALIGGFVLQVEDYQVDASVATKLKKIKRVLLESPK